MATYPHMRLRRTRKADWSRRLTRETTLTRDDLIWTIVLSDGKPARAPVPSMPGVDRVNLKEVVKDCLLYTSPSPRDRTRSRMPSSA